LGGNTDSTKKKKKKFTAGMRALYGGDFWSGKMVKRQPHKKSKRREKGTSSRANQNCGLVVSAACHPTGRGGGDRQREGKGYSGQGGCQNKLSRNVFIKVEDHLV